MGILRRRRYEINTKHETLNMKKETRNRKLETGNRSLKFKVYSCKFKTGQTLIEVLIAFAVTVIIGVGLVTAGLATQKAAASARNESQATKLAQEYMEKLRVMRDSRGWKDFVLTLDSGEYRINIPSGSEYNVANWSLSNAWTLTGTYCVNSSIGTSSPLRGDKVTVGNVDFCRKIIIPSDPGSDIKAIFKVEVGWKEGNNVRSTRAETVLSKWCGAVIDASDPADCPD